MTADWDLTKGIEDRTGYRVSFALVDTTRKDCLRILDQLADAVLSHLGLSRWGAAVRWSKAMTGLDLINGKPV